jgi:hypothetical protein
VCGTVTSHSEVVSMGRLSTLPAPDSDTRAGIKKVLERGGEGSALGVKGTPTLAVVPGWMPMAAYSELNGGSLLL